MSKYRHEAVREDYTHYASGNVFLSMPGQPGFPVRLASEVFQTCFQLRARTGGARDRVVLYDPCCGAGYLLVTTAFRHWAQIRFVIGSDIREEALVLARGNLSLLEESGLAARLDEIEEAQGREWRASREEAVRGVHFFLERHALLSARHPIGVRISRADAGSPQEVKAAVDDLLVDVAMVDVPYGELSDWQGTLRTLATREDAISRMLDSLLGVLSPGAVVAIVSPKRETVAHPGYARRKRLKIGKRMVTYLSPLP
jgi:hypothetical protein